METEKYSRDAFERLKERQAVRNLADQLQAEVLRELHPAVEKAFTKIIEQINAKGHGLTLYEKSPGELAFRDEKVRGQCLLRLACDVVISAGYADTVELKP